MSKSASTPKKSKVFISYSHDREVWLKRGLPADTHKRRVYSLASRLRTEGIECVIDQYLQSPEEGWPRWTKNQIEEAHFVLVIASQNYNCRFQGQADSPRGSGAQWEGAIITQTLYEANGKNLKFIPVVFEESDITHIPNLLRPWTFYGSAANFRV